ncbi:hypothetical protein [Thiomicrorhabdus sp.]|uniref:hypothetical protein n=1 Tax=Thiomicrorhabdus sp. TaxID=2039724 RepID=UPI0029C94ACC|nr:hypothetical protein [Thiomicrorhabdus sp.]
MVLMSFSEFADLQGVSAARVTQWKDEGRLVLVEQDGRKKPLINVEASKRLIKNTTDLARAENGRNAKTAKDKLAGSLSVISMLAEDELTSKLKTATVHKAESEALMAELKLNQEAKEFVHAKLVDITIGSVASEIRLGLERLPSKVSGKLASMTDRIEIEKDLMSAIDEVLADLANNIRRQRQKFIDAEQEIAE